MCIKPYRTPSDLKKRNLIRSYKPTPLWVRLIQRWKLLLALLFSVCMILVLLVWLSEHWHFVAPREMVE